MSKNILTEAEVMRSIVQRITEAPKDIGVYGYEISEHYMTGQETKKFKFLLPGNIDDEDDLKYYLEEKDILFLWPDSQMEEFMQKLRAGQMVVWPHEEGACGLTPNKADFQTLKQKVEQEFSNFDNDEEGWDDEDDW